MKKVKAIMAFTAAIAMMFATVAFAAPSPVAGTVTVVVPGGKGATAAQVKTPTTAELKALADFITTNSATLGMGASVKSTIDIIAPAGYTGGNVPVVFAAAGLKNGAKNVFAYILGPNGKITIVPCYVHNGYVGFYAPVFGSVAIVELNPVTAAPKSAATPAATSALPATLH